MKWPPTGTTSNGHRTAPDDKLADTHIFTLFISHFMFRTLELTSCYKPHPTVTWNGLPCSSSNAKIGNKRHHQPRWDKMYLIHLINQPTNQPGIPFQKPEAIHGRREHMLYRLAYIDFTYFLVSSAINGEAMRQNWRTLDQPPGRSCLDVGIPCPICAHLFLKSWQKILSTDHLPTWGPLLSGRSMGFAND